VPYTPSDSLLGDKLTRRCDILGTTYRIRGKYFFCTNCLQASNDKPHFNIQIPLTRTDHTLTITTQKYLFSTTSQRNCRWSNMIYYWAIGNTQLFFPILYFRSTRLPYGALLFHMVLTHVYRKRRCKLPLPHFHNCTLVSSYVTTCLNAHDET